MVKITKSVVDALTPAGGRPTFAWDDGLKGFGVKCLPSGTKRYLVKYRANGGGRSAPQRWLAIGTHGQLTPDQARKLAQQALAAVARGEDPQRGKMEMRAAERLDQLWERFAREHLSLRKPKTVVEYSAQWRNILQPRIGRLVVAEISSGDVDRLHKSLSKTPYQANRVLALLSKLMTLAEVWHMRPSGSNPCRNVARFKESSRDRYLTGEEVRRLSETATSMVKSKEISRSSGVAIALLLLTGARLNEILSLRWDWVDFPKRVIFLPDSKTGARKIYLSRKAALLLRFQRRNSSHARFVFPGSGAEGHMINLRKPWAKICGRANIGGVRLHDLRHTAASLAVGQGASLPIIGALLGHSQPQTTQRYAHVDASPALQAAEALGVALTGFSAGKSGKSRQT